MNAIIFGEIFPMFTMMVFLCTETSRPMVVAPLVRRLWKCVWARDYFTKSQKIKRNPTRVFLILFFS